MICVTLCRMQKVTPVTPKSAVFVEPASQPPAEMPRSAKHSDFGLCSRKMGHFATYQYYYCGL